MLTCCALQSACYSPTGIVIWFILSQFHGEVQTNLTVKRAKNALFHRARRFRMPAAIGLRHPASASCLGRHLRLAGRCPNNSSLLPPLAAVVVVALWAFSAEKLFIISRLSRSAERSKRYFHGRGVATANGSCSAAFCESAALRGTNPLRLTAFASSPEGGAFGKEMKSAWTAKGSPFGRAVTEGD